VEGWLFGMGCGVVVGELAGRYGNDLVLYVRFDDN
jgi:hypothetical protein